MLTPYMKKDHPLITIGFTCFNAQDSITRAIECAQAQTWPNIEILVVDDGSADNSVSVINDLIVKDSRIRLIEHVTNKGTAIARTSLAENAKGAFIAFFDDDDVSVPERLEKQYARIIEYEKKHSTDMVFCYCNRQVVNIHGEWVDEIGYGIGRCAPEPHGTDIVDIILWNKGREGHSQKSFVGQLGSGTLMMRTSIYEKTGYFDERFRRSAEIDLAIRAGQLGAHFISVDEPLLIQHKTASTNKSGKRPLQYALLLCEKNKDYLKKNRVYWAAIALAYSKFYKNSTLLSGFYKALACLCSPDKVLAGIVKRKFS